MNRISGFMAIVLVLVIQTPIFTSWIPLSVHFPTPAKTFLGNHAFRHATGTKDPAGWGAYYRHHKPGYLVKGLKSGGEILPEAIYRYDFYFTRRPGHLSSWLDKANDVVRVEVFDATADEVLAERTFQLADMEAVPAYPLRKGIRFSTLGRQGHRIEPRVFWQGLSGVALSRVERLDLATSDLPALGEKTNLFEQQMRDHFIDRGYVIVRNAQGEMDDLGDAAIWTGLYAASQALRYRVSQNPDALKHMEESLWALHRLHQSATVRGTLVRHVDGKGRALSLPPSKDTYTGFFYAAAQALPLVKNPSLRKALLRDVEALADHFIQHDLSFRSSPSYAVDLNPYPSAYFVQEAVAALKTDASLRRGVIKGLRLARWYFWLSRQSPPPALGRMISILKKKDMVRFEKELLPFLNDVWFALRILQRNVHRSALRGARQGLTDMPYAKFDLLLLRLLNSLSQNAPGQRIESLEQLKIFPSQSLHALHMLKVAAETFPKPNRFETYYRDNLYDGKALLRTLTQWHQFDEDLITILAGDTAGATMRTSSAHLSYLALHNLILLEKDPLTRFKYQKFFETQYRPMRGDANAMIDAMHATVGLSTKQLGLAWWSLGLYPVDRRGRGAAFWKAHREMLLDYFGGLSNRQARDPLTPDIRPRDAFLWQRSARSIRGDHKDWLYPPLDYLFAYWLARSRASLEAVAEKS